MGAREGRAGRGSFSNVVGKSTRSAPGAPPKAAPGDCSNEIGTTPPPGPAPGPFPARGNGPPGPQIGHPFRPGEFDP